MDVTKTVKINNLAKELLKHGLVKSLDEGVEYAAKHVDKEEAEIIEQAKEVKPETENDNINNNIRILERKLNYLTKSFAEQFNREMDSVRKQIKLINSELSSMREKLKTSSIQQPRAKSTQEEPQQKLTEEKTETKKDEEPKPRTGDLTPDDVKIEDYFYFGDKK